MLGGDNERQTTFRNGSIPQAWYIRKATTPSLTQATPMKQLSQLWSTSALDVVSGAEPASIVALTFHLNSKNNFKHHRLECRR